MEVGQQESIWMQRGLSKFSAGDNLVIKAVLDPGLYILKNENYVNCAYKIPYKNDELVDLEQPETDEVFGMVEDFCNKQELYDKWNFRYRRGVLLYGVPGTGKTSIIQKSIAYWIEKVGGVCFLIQSPEELARYHAWFPTTFRGIEPNRMVLTIFEDIDGMVQAKESETCLINMLDGIGDPSNTFNMATTNYTEKLSDRLGKRAGRFDRKIEVKSPSFETRERFLSHKILPENLSQINMEEWCKTTEGFTMAELSELIKSYFLVGLSLEDSISHIKHLGKTVVSSSYNKETKVLGFK